MSESAKKKYFPRNRDIPALEGHDKAMNTKQLQPVKDKKHDSAAIERAVYDGMRDLRAMSPEKKMPPRAG